MNCKSFLGLILFLFFLLMSVSYASDNHISIEPLGLGQDGLYEITLSGERFSEECWVGHSGHEIFFPAPDLYGGLILFANIKVKPGPSSERCSFSTTMIVYLPPATYTVELRIYTNFGLPEAAEFTSNLEDNQHLYVEKSSVPIDIQNVNAEIHIPDSFTLRNILVPGYEDTYWGEFEWNPDRLSFDLENAGVD